MLEIFIGIYIIMEIIVVLFIQQPELLQQALPIHWLMHQHWIHLTQVKVQSIYFVRVRAYSPSGTMPSVGFGGVSS